MRVKCLAQEHTRMIEPGPLNLEISTHYNHWAKVPPSKQGIEFITLHHVVVSCIKVKTIAACKELNHNIFNIVLSLVLRLRSQQGVNS